MVKKERRLTRQRQVILEELKKVTSHPRADEIYQMVRKRIPNISFGTVYRNLKVLKELGEIMELKWGTFRRFDGNPKNHQHFTCLECGKVYDLDIPVETELRREVTKKTGFEVLSHRLEFYGRCLNCKAQRLKDLDETKSLRKEGEKNGLWILQ